MSCPMYKDFTRECIETFEVIIHLSNINFCESDRHKECPFYRYINETEKRCEYAERCLHGKTVLETPFERMVSVSKTYCFCENKVNCERYKVMKSGKVTPEGLGVDGRRIELEVGK